MPQTPEEKKVTEIVSEAQAKTTILDETARQQGPAPQPAPPGGGMFMGPQPGAGILDQAAIAHQKEAIRQEALNKSAEAIKDAPVSTQTKAFKIVDEYAYPETARKNDQKLKKEEEKGVNETQRSAMHQMGYTNMKARHGKEKEVSESQDYAMRTLGDEKEKSKQEPKKESEPFKGASMSKSFSASLGYNKLNKPLEKAADAKDEKQPIEMSGKFSATLGYNNMNKSDRSASLAKEMKSNGRDITKD